VTATVVDLIRWFYLNSRCRFESLPNNPTDLEKLANDLQVPLAYGIDIALGQQCIRDKPGSFRWRAPLILIALLYALIVGTRFVSPF
jgi:hypothetical protein